MTTTKTVKKKTSTKKKLVKKQLQEQESVMSISTSWNNEKIQEAKTILANEYFNGVKTKAEYLQDEDIIKEMKYLPAQIEQLKQVGQNGLAEKLKKNIKYLFNERLLLKNGFDKYVHRKDVTRYVELVKDKKVHVCELDKFPRLIPDAPRALLLKAQSLNIFKDFWVVYVDYTGDSDSMLTDEEKKQRAKNRDPIIFGTFESVETGTIDKMYFICDWTDEYCDLTQNGNKIDISAEELEYVKKTMIVYKSVIGISINNPNNKLFYDKVMDSRGDGFNSASIHIHL